MRRQLGEAEGDRDLAEEDAGHVQKNAGPPAS